MEFLPWINLSVLIVLLVLVAIVMTKLAAMDAFMRVEPKAGVVIGEKIEVHASGVPGNDFGNRMSSNIVGEVVFSYTFLQDVEELFRERMSNPKFQLNFRGLRSAMDGLQRGEQEDINVLLDYDDFTAMRFQQDS